MLRSTASKVMWVGRATIFLVGLAVVLFLTLAMVAQAADAAKRVPALKKGVVNTVNTMTTLVGSIANPILKLDNNGTGTALQLDVQPGNPPLVVNADAGTATNLKAEDANTLDGNNSTDFLGATQQAADSDKLDGKEPGQLPGSIASVTTIRDFPGIPFELGGTGTPNEVIPWKFVGAPETGITTTSTQRLVGAAEVPLADPTPTGFSYDLCYRPSAGGTITSFNGDTFQSAATLASTDVVYTATSSVVPGAGTWDVGFCVKPHAGGRNAERVSSVNGWVMVVNQ